MFNQFFLSPHACKEMQISFFFREAVFVIKKIIFVEVAFEKDSNFFPSSFNGL